MFGHQPLVVYLCVSECICVCDIAEWFIFSCRRGVVLLNNWGVSTGQIEGRINLYTSILWDLTSKASFIKNASVSTRASNNTWCVK